MPDISLKQFTRKLYMETEIKVGVKDILGAPTDAIVNPANSGLSHGAGLAATIAEAAGELMEQDCEKIIQKYGRVPKTFAVATRAGNLPYRCIIHSVGPRMGDGDEYDKLKKTIFNTMRVCFNKNLKSIAFPAISTGIFGVPKDICARAFIGALDQFWRDKDHRRINLVWVCLTLDDFLHFEKVMNC
jgi:O-acetyl-ADP-ribose deacetylase (regulator of RNase III)